MRTTLLALLIATATLAQKPDQAPPKGHLLIVGGGGTPESVLARGLELAGGPGAPIAIVPQASQRRNAGESTATMWREAGAKKIRVLTNLKTAGARRDLTRARLIWMPGGAQDRLFQALKDAKLVDLLRERYREGAVIGGTSAGAAVQSDPMIAGNGTSRTVGAARAEISGGLGLLRGWIIDQHFHARGRFPRLLSAVLRDRRRLGLGIDERTAVIVDQTGFDVLGERSVLILDARRAEPIGEDTTADGSFVDMKVHHLRRGRRWDFAKGPVMK